MKLAKLFAAQKELREHIGYNGSDRFEKLILALLVELGECANEQRTWKFWSTDRKPRTDQLIECDDCKGSGRDYTGYCGSCHGGYVGKRNPLLEEYVDGLHFVLELGIEVAEEISFDVSEYFEGVEREIKQSSLNEKTITGQFHDVFYLVSTIDYDFDFPYLFASYYRLGELLGFTWEQIEQAYFEKNAINHSRQEEGY